MAKKEKVPKHDHDWGPELTRRWELKDVKMVTTFVVCQYPGCNEHLDIHEGPKH